MPQTATRIDRLALLGGTPVIGEPIGVPWPPVDEATAEDLADVYRSREWSFNGKREHDFAAKFAQYHGAKHGIMMVNGTVTLEAILASLGIGPGDEVIVPAITWMATGMAVHYVGATPVFVDVEPTTLCLDATKLEAARTPRTRGVIPVHLYGSMADMEAIGAWAAKHDIHVVEDCAHMHGGKWNGRGVGSWGVAGSFSFQQSKPMASGEGGICITSDDALAERLFRFKHIGYADGSVQGQATSAPPRGLVCHNYRATEFQAVILQHQLRDLPMRIEKYERSAARLTRRLAAEPAAGLRVQSRGRLANPQGYFEFLTIVDRGPLTDIPMAVIYKALAAEGLSTQGTYGPVYRHKLWNLEPNQYRIADQCCPVAEGVATRCVDMVHRLLGLDEADIDHIADALLKVAANADQLRNVKLDG